MNGDEIRKRMRDAEAKAAFQLEGSARTAYQMAVIVDILAELADEVLRQEQYHAVNRQSHDSIVDRIEALTGLTMTDKRTAEERAPMELEPSGRTMTDLERFVAQLRDGGKFLQEWAGTTGPGDAGRGADMQAAAEMLEYVYHPKLLPPFAIATVDALAAKALGNSTQDESPKQSVPPT